MKSQWKVPKPNCCIFYKAINFGSYSEELCFNEATGKTNEMMMIPPMSLECGSQTFSVIGVAKSIDSARIGKGFEQNFGGTVGRV